MENEIAIRGFGEIDSYALNLDFIPCKKCNQTYEDLSRYLGHPELGLSFFAETSLSSLSPVVGALEDSQFGKTKSKRGLRKEIKMSCSEEEVTSPQSLQCNQFKQRLNTQDPLTEMMSTGFRISRHSKMI